MHMVSIGLVLLACFTASDLARIRQSNVDGILDAMAAGSSEDGADGGSAGPVDGADAEGSADGSDGLDAQGSAGGWVSWLSRWVRWFSAVSGFGALFQAAILEIVVVYPKASPLPPAPLLAGWLSNYWIV